MQIQKSQPQFLLLKNIKSSFAGKKLFVLFILFAITSFSLNAQNCSTYLDAFVPTATDPVKEVKIVIHRFKPSVAIGVWDQVTQADVDNMINGANYTFSTIPAPNLTIPGVPHIPDAKIKLVLAAFNTYTDDLAYASASVAYTGNGNPNGSYADDNAINLFLCEFWPGQRRETSPAKSTGTGHYIHFGTNVPSFVGTYGADLAHEVGHMLGLNHTASDEGYSYIQHNYGCGCTTSGTSDYVLVSPNHPWVNNCTGISNNLMNRFAGCYAYLSPRQMAVMHYWLMTEKTNWLTANSYTAATATNPAYDYSVTASETWTTSRYMKGNITVKAGKVLTIQCHVGMPYGGKITVEKTGLLVVNGGTITSISNQSWDGIYVCGDPAKSQALNPSNTNFAQFQGWAKFYNATISHAKIAVRNHNNPWSENGGIITAYNTNFLDNQTDVQQIGPNSTPAGFASASRFYNCSFRTTDVIGSNLAPYARAYMYRSVGAAFYGCYFEYAAGAIYGDPGHGIYSINSKFTVDKNGATPTSFIGFNRGVYVNNWNPLNVPSISNSQFFDNTNFGAYFMNANTLVFQKNLVQNPGALTAFSGLYLNNCKYYTIKNNAFTEDLNNKASVALSIYNSTGGAHQVYRNSFSKSWIAINAMGNNSGLTNNTDGLKMNCNDFTPTANIYDIALDLGNANVAPSVMRDQGAILGQNTSNLIRNMYAATCVNNNENKWYIHATRSKAINHGCNNTSANGAITKPSPQPSCSRSIVNIVTSNIILDYQAHCLGTTPSSGGTGTTQTQRLSNMNSYLVDLKADNTDGKNNFEIEATVASKINLFIGDSLNNGQDSVIALLNSNQGNLPDADIQTVFAYMAKGDYSGAQTKVNELQNRADWATLLTKLILVDQYAGGMSDLTIADRRFFEGYATTEGKDGQSIAQAVLKGGGFNNYSEPHNYPEGTSTARLVAPQVDSKKNEEDKGLKSLLIYPNPTKTGITLYYNSESDSEFKLEIRDLLGRLIYTNFITGKLIKQYIPLDQFNTGMYLITISRNNEIINKTKIIKED